MKAKNTNAHESSWDLESIGDDAHWRSGVIVALLLFVVQAIYFESPYIIRNTPVRTNLIKVCQLLGCQLPDYKNTNELDIIQTSFSRLPDGSYLVRTIISNQAAFAQPYPNLMLTLRDYAGNPFSRRLFSPQDYLPQALIETSDIPASATLEINLNIVEPITSLGGYTFELSY